MEAPAVQYVQTSDGYSIAYTDTGAGMPFVLMPLPAGHVQMHWTGQSQISAWVRALSERFRLIVYDCRGQGMSQRGLTPDFDMSAPIRDLEAVVDGLALDRFVLMGSHASGHTAVRYAVKQPQRLYAMILAPCGASASKWPMISAVDVAQRNWEFFLEIFATSRGARSAEAQKTTIDFLRQTVNQEDWLIMASSWMKSDISALLGSVATPSLVMHPREYVNVPPEESMKLASAIASARMALTDGNNPFGEAESGLPVIEDFLDGIRLHEDPSTSVGRTGSVLVANLSRREVEVLRLIASGKSSREIGEELVLSVRTVDRHIANIYLKTETHSRAQVTAYAMRHGYL
jgi:DNA-binding CsgD family transcriptional regulator/pimeloyl-ACP methyl ester carboxylesterase